MRMMPLMARVPLLILVGSLLLMVGPMLPAASAVSASGNRGVELTIHVDLTSCCVSE